MKTRNIRAIAPLQSWDIFAQYRVLCSIKNEKQKDFDILNVLAKKHQWSFDTNSIYREDYTTIVITDHTQQIEWVNSGFTDMTGFTKSYAIGRHPSFLQGKDTSIETKSKIRTAIENKEPITQDLLNYKKDGTPYLCSVKIIPIFNHIDIITHFIAFEKKVRVA